MTVEKKQEAIYSASDCILPAGPCEGEVESPKVSHLFDENWVNKWIKRVSETQIPANIWVETCAAIVLNHYNSTQSLRYVCFQFDSEGFVAGEKRIDAHKGSFYEVAGQITGEENEANETADAEICLIIQEDASIGFYDKMRELITQRWKEQTNGLYILFYKKEDSYLLEVLTKDSKYGADDLNQLCERLVNMLEYSLTMDIKKERKCPLTKNEKEMLGRLNQTEAHYDRNHTVVDLFNLSAELNQNAIALSCQEKAVTYKELNRRSNEIYYFLKQKHIKHGEIVAVICERGTQFFEAVLGVMKAGAAYLPIDPNYTPDRIRFILENSKAVMILSHTEKDMTEYKTPAYEIETVRVVGGEDTRKRINECRPKDAAYCIYTSGTTGMPKGVLVSHEAFYNFIAYSKKTMTVKNCKIVAPLFTSHCFDLSIPSIYLPICFGGTVDIIPRQEEHDVASLIDSGKYTFLKLTPSHLKLLQGERKVPLQKPCAIVVGGERLEQTLIDYMYFRYGEALNLINEYGPTEACVGTTIYPTKEKCRYHCVPIGKPIANAKVYILDNDFEPCRIGELGELCIGGIGVALGYIGDRGSLKEKDREKFRPNPFDRGMLYRTGDYAVFLPDGNVKYVGRIDQQVKINGYRIDLFEINDCLRNENPQITDSVILAVSNENQERELCAYYVSETRQEQKTLRSSVAGKLPGYMVPRWFIPVEKMPLTANGKLDTAKLEALPRIHEEEVVKERVDVSCGELELIQQMAQILLVPESLIGVEDDFFELGGNSLRASRLVHAIEEMWDIPISINAVFECRTPKRLAEQIEILRCRDKKSHSSIRKAQKQEAYRATPTQNRMFFLQNRDGGCTYNLPKKIVVEGRPDKERLKSAFWQVIQKHEILRTRFEMRGDVLYQVIEDEGNLEFEAWQETKPVDDTYLERLIRPFDLTKPTQLRVSVIDTGEQTVLFMDMHHIISDGMTLELFANEVSNAYNGFFDEHATYQFKDYSDWYLNRSLEEQKKFWLSELDGYAGTVNLPTDYARKKNAYPKGKTIRAELGEGYTERLTAFGKAHHSSDYMLFLSVALLLIRLYSREDDVAVGSVVSGRSIKKTENMLGAFINTIVMREVMKSGESFEEYFARIRSKCLQVYENQEYPFDDLVHDILGSTKSTGNPLFNVMFALQNNQRAAYRFGDLRASYSSIETGEAMFDLELIVELSEQNNYSIGLTYDIGLYKQQTAEAMLEHYVNMVKGVLDRTDTTYSIEDLPYLDCAEEKLVREEFNRTDYPYDRAATVVDIFEHMAQVYPNRPALITQEKTLTYRELNERANEIAHALREDYEVRPDDFVALSFGRGIDMITAMFGIMKAGAAYVPIDPTYPSARVEYIFRDCMPKVFIRESQTIGIVQNVAQEVLFANLKSGKTQNPVRVLKPDNLAYVIYTSGTTGNPKGVLIEHRTVNNFRNFFEHTYRIRETDRFLQFARIIFDASVWEWVGSLLFGAALCIPEEEMINDTMLLARFAKEKKVTQALLPPQYQNEACLGGLKILTTGGSAATEELMQNSSAINETYMNIYGPTECTVAITGWTYDENRKAGEAIPIGKPQPNVKAYILNGMSLCGIGMPGELCFGGDCLARGYLNKDSITKEKFVIHPQVGKIYRTGDLARWSADGNILYMGRIDAQVKLSGYRIELGEIENIAMKYPEVVDAVAIVRKNEESGKDFLLLYFSAKETVNTEKLKTHLEEFLPEYMVPMGYKQLEKIPTGRTGKVDVSNLPPIIMDEDEEYVAPRNEIEKAVAGLFEEILGIKHVGAKGDFFKNGGRSLNTSALLKRTRELFHIQLSYRELYANPSVDKIALLIESRLKTA